MPNPPKPLSKEDRRFVAEYFREIYLPEKLGFEKNCEISDCYSKAYNFPINTGTAKMIAGQNGIQKLKKAKYIAVFLDKIKLKIEEKLEKKEEINITNILDYCFNYDYRAEFSVKKQNKIKKEKLSEERKEARETRRMEKRKIEAKEARNQNKIINGDQKEVFEVVKEEVLDVLNEKSKSKKDIEKNNKKANEIANDLSIIINQLTTKERFDLIEKINKGGVEKFIEIMTLDGIIRNRQGETVQDPITGTEIFIKPNEKHQKGYLELLAKIKGIIKPNALNLQINNLFSRNENGILCGDGEIKDVK